MKVIGDDSVIRLKYGCNHIKTFNMKNKHDYERIKRFVNKRKVNKILKIYGLDEKIAKCVDIIWDECPNITSINVTINDVEYLTHVYEMIDKYNIKYIKLKIEETRCEHIVELCRNIVNLYYCKNKIFELKFINFTGNVKDLIELFSIYEEYDYNISFVFRYIERGDKFSSISKSLYNFDNLTMSYKYKMEFEGTEEWKETKLYKFKKYLIKSIISLSEVLNTGCLLFVKDFLF
jgi:hypothetical protein